ncbi:MAG: hypothetical protein RLZZ292_1181 [Bacteroidota bacterium]
MHIQKKQRKDTKKTLTPYWLFMIEISVQQLGKRYLRDWIFRKLDKNFVQGNGYALLGPNGSGKSTLLKVLSGNVTPSKGKISFLLNGKKIEDDAVYQYISYAAPYIELIEELTLLESLEFHRKFKKIIQNLDNEAIISILGLEKARNKPIRHFSSGMKQRVKLVLALLSDAPIVLLDEPTTNLDAQGAAWYQDLLRTYAPNRLVFIATNVEEDYAFFCSETIVLSEYK